MGVGTVPAAAIYVRVSTSRQEDEGTSLETQEASCRAYCAEHGYPVAAVYRETHTASDLFGRKQLGALRETVRKREVGVVVAHALDRLTRDQAHLGLILTEADYAGVAIELVTERIEDTPEGRLIQAVRGFVAEVERLKIAERTQRGRAARVASGKPLPKRGDPPLGLGTLHRHRHRPFRPHQDDEPLASRDARVQQVALEHHVVLRVDRDHDDRVLAALTLVDRHRVGRL